MPAIPGDQLDIKKASFSTFDLRIVYNLCYKERDLLE